VSPVEALAAALAVGMVVLNIRQIHWGWGLAIASSALYTLVFVRAGLLGQAALQGLFIAVATWGWWVWLRGRKPVAGSTSPALPLPVSRLTRTQWGLTVVAAALLALGFTLALGALGGQQPWLDGTLTACAVVAQVLLALKKRENWLWWLFVNAASLALFAQAGLWLTTVLYALFTVMSMAGWRAWRQR
jgi:nicotinamide mononucleotide transporter